MPVEAWRELVSSKVGVIREIAPQGRGAEEAVPPYLHTATLSNFDFRTAEKSERIAAGKGRTEGEAIASAIAEAIERYCAFQWDGARTFLAVQDALETPSISPSDCVLFNERQYALEDWRTVRWKPADPITWMMGVELPEATPVALPASLVYLVTPPPRIEDFFVPATSNGMAAGPTLSAAVFGGLCELIERDALMIAWMNRLPSIEIDLAGSGGLARDIARHYAGIGVEIRAFLLPTDLPASVVMAVSFDPDPRKPAQVVGMGCHLDPAIALVKAVFEMCQGRPAEARRFVDKPPQGRLARYEDVKTLDDHSAFAALRERRDEFAFLWEPLRARAISATDRTDLTVNVAGGGNVRRPIQDLANPSRGDVDLDLDYCVRALRALDVRVAYADLTLPDVAPFGIHAVRVLASHLQPIHFGHDTARLGGRRLFDVPQRLGFADRPRTEADLNPCPHPMA